MLCMSTDKLTDWIVNLEEHTATHKKGWVFKFAVVGDEAYGYCEYVCIDGPQNVLMGHFPGEQQRAYEALEAYFHALSKKTGQEP